MPKKTKERKKEGKKEISWRQHVTSVWRRRPKNGVVDWNRSSKREDQQKNKASMGHGICLSITQPIRIGSKEQVTKIKLQVNNGETLNTASSSTSSKTDWDSKLHITNIYNL